MKPLFFVTVINSYWNETNVVVALVNQIILLNNNESTLLSYSNVNQNLKRK